MVRGVWFDSMPGCNRLLLQSSGCTRFWLLPGLSLLPVKAYLHEMLSGHRIVQNTRASERVVKELGMGFRVETNKSGGCMLILVYCSAAPKTTQLRWACGNQGRQSDLSGCQPTCFRLPPPEIRPFILFTKAAMPCLCFKYSKAIECRCRDLNLAITNYSTKHTISPRKGSLLPALPWVGWVCRVVGGGVGRRSSVGLFLQQAHREAPAKLMYGTTSSELACTVAPSRSAVAHLRLMQTRQSSSKIGCFSISSMGVGVGRTSDLWFCEPTKCSSSWKILYQSFRTALPVLKPSHPWSCSYSTVTPLTMTAPNADQTATSTLWNVGNACGCSVEFSLKKPQPKRTGLFKTLKQHGWWCWTSVSTWQAQYAYNILLIIVCVSIAENEVLGEWPHHLSHADIYRWVSYAARLVEAIVSARARG